MEKSSTQKNILDVIYTNDRESNSMNLESLNLDLSSRQDGEDVYISTAKFLEFIKNAEIKVPYETTFSFDKYIKQLKSKYQANEDNGQKTILSLLETSEANLYRRDVLRCTMSKAAFDRVITNPSHHQPDAFRKFCSAVRGRKYFRDQVRKTLKPTYDEQ